MTVFPVILLISWLLTGCADNGDGGQGTGDGDNQPQWHYIAGVSALGRAGAWSLNCLDDVCVRAAEDGRYQLTAQMPDSTLMWSDIDDQQGGQQRLFSRYRNTPGLTSALVNLNPSTDALLQARSFFQQNQSLDACLEQAGCPENFISQFSVEQEQVMISQLQQLMGDAWPDRRNPFADLYQANASDPLDVLHDAIQYVVSADQLALYNNAGQLMTAVALSRLMYANALDDVQLSREQYDAARQLPPVLEPIGQISLRVSFSPSTTAQAPVSVSADASLSASTTGGVLSIQHDLTLASGFNRRLYGATVQAEIEEAGDHIWVVTATDETGFEASQGYLLSTWGDTGLPIQYGSQGSCMTPAPLTANSLNICQEVENGSELGPCDEVSSLSVSLVAAPGRCALEAQHTGLLFGVCTDLVNELRTFFYDNPERYISTETFEEKQQRVARQCVQSLAGQWSLQAN